VDGGIYMCDVRRGVLQSPDMADIEYYSAVIIKKLLILIIFPVKILAEDTFDSFLVQMRGRRDENGNITFVGDWKNLPRIAKTMRCGKYPKAAIVDKGIHLAA
jgi:hypothetical protein